MTEPQCALCGASGPATPVRDELTEPPRELLLCESCAEIERGRIAVASMRLAGHELDGEPVTEEELRKLAREMDGLWTDCPPEALAALEALDDPEGLAELADILREIGARSERPPSDAVRAFVRRHARQRGPLA